MLKVVALDCDCIAVSNIDWLHSDKSVKVMPVSNDRHKLPKVNESTRVGVVVPVFKQSSDFYIISEISRIITDCILTKEKLPIFHLVTKDSGLAAGAKYLCRKNRTQCYVHGSLRGLAIHLQT
ncbi:hypothetical protein [Vibrio breoganii]|uniref:hypothetical protein n=1 Tax=Vibrio breoganii TaxID=553239 RepID=UPI000C859E13|nr:hypothetical protein [Vibrio breoganii]PMO78046.1 hypothetical protein BCT02_07010 [Vibrio breoganii]PMO87908.1 hypothetical protein BCS99_08685 [Vibrio breoganii]